MVKVKSSISLKNLHKAGLSYKTDINFGSSDRLLLFLLYIYTRRYSRQPSQVVILHNLLIEPALWNYHTTHFDEENIMCTHKRKA